MDAPPLAPGPCAERRHRERMAAADGWRALPGGQHDGTVRGPAIEDEEDDMRGVIEAPGAPAPIGPYSVGIATESLVFCAAQAGIDPLTGRLVSGGTEAETEQAMRNLAAVLAGDGLTFADVVKTTIYVVDIGEFGVVNRVYGRLMGDRPPARTTVGVAALPIGARIEIEMIAVRRTG